METYTDFGVSYLIQTFINKINTKLWKNCRVIPTPPPNRIFPRSGMHTHTSPSPPPWIQIFRKNIWHLWNHWKYVVRIEAVVLTLLTKVTWHNCFFRQTSGFTPARTPTTSGLGTPLHTSHLGIVKVTRSVTPIATISRRRKVLTLNQKAFAFTTQSFLI